LQTPEEIRADARALAESLMEVSAYERLLFLQALLEDIELLLRAPRVHAATQKGLVL
jgi:hypothetical protein